MSNTFKLSVKYYNKDTPEDYEYTLDDTVQSFLAKHPNIGDASINIIFVGIYMYLEDSQELMHTVVNYREEGKPILAFPEIVTINFTHTNIFKDQQSQQLEFYPASTWDNFSAIVCDTFNIKVNARWLLNSKEVREFPVSFHLFDFSTTDYTIEEVCWDS